jgi:hypothetical protein
MYTLTCDRRQFVELIAKRKPLRVGDGCITEDLERVALSNDEVIVVWKRPAFDSFVFPNAIIVSERSTTEFLAWVSTYFRHIRPFTAHCRVLTPSTARLAMHSIESPPNLNLGSADVGLIVAEAAAYCVGKTAPSRVSYSGFSRTLSFAVSESVWRYAVSQSTYNLLLDSVRDGWLSARKATSQPSLALTPIEISEVWSTLMDSAGEETLVGCDSGFVGALRGVRKGGLASNDALTQLFSQLENMRSLGESLGGPREGRVNAVETAVRELRRGPDSTRKLRAFILGFMASRVQPGSLDHLPLLFPLAGELPQCLLWYGAFAGLSPEASVDNFGDGCGLLIRRELGRSIHWLDRPSCDIALSELLVLLGDRLSPRPVLPTLVSGTLTVEIFPKIATSVKWLDHVDESGGESQKATYKGNKLFSEDSRFIETLTELARKLNENSMALDAICRNFGGPVGEQSLKGRKRRK